MGYIMKACTKQYLSSNGVDENVMLGLDKFLNGVLQYRHNPENRPTPESDEGMVTLKISDLTNMFDSGFGLSGCGDTASYLVITTSLAEFLAEHQGKFVIGIFPHFWVKKKIATTASPFSAIMEEWDGVNAPVGIFWRWGTWRDTEFDYLTRSTLVDISSRNLYKNWIRSCDAPCGRRRNGRHTASGLGPPTLTMLYGTGQFHVCFELK